MTFLPWLDCVPVVASSDFQLWLNHFVKVYHCPRLGEFRTPWDLVFCGWCFCCFFRCSCKVSVYAFCKRMIRLVMWWSWVILWTILCFINSSYLDSMYIVTWWGFSAVNSLLFFGAKAPGPSPNNSHVSKSMYKPAVVTEDACIVERIISCILDHWVYVWRDEGVVQSTVSSFVCRRYLGAL